MRAARAPDAAEMTDVGQAEHRPSLSESPPSMAALSSRTGEGDGTGTASQFDEHQLPTSHKTCLLAALARRLTAARAR